MSVNSAALHFKNQQLSLCVYFSYFARLAADLTNEKLQKCICLFTLCVHSNLVNDLKIEIL